MKTKFTRILSVLLVAIMLLGTMEISSAHAVDVSFDSGARTASSSEIMPADTVKVKKGTVDINGKALDSLECLIPYTVLSVTNGYARVEGEESLENLKRIGISDGATLGQHLAPLSTTDALRIASRVMVSCKTKSFTISVSDLEIVESISPNRDIRKPVGDLSTSDLGSKVRYVYDAETKCLTISGQGTMRDYDYDNSRIKRVWEDAVRVVIEDGVTNIGEEIFRGCTNIREVQIGNTVKEIKSYAFMSCTNLESIVLPKSVDTIRHSAFMKCTNLKQVKITGPTSRDISWAFTECSNLKSVIIEDNVIGIGPAALIDCSNLEFAIIGDGTSYIDDFSFYNCHSLKFVVIPDSITEITQYAFTGDVVSNNSGGSAPPSSSSDSETDSETKIVPLSQTIVFYGKKGSYAEDYIKNNTNYEFVCIDENADVDIKDYASYLSPEHYALYTQYNDIETPTCTVSYRSSFYSYKKVYRDDEYLYPKKTVNLGDFVPEVPDPSLEGFTFSGWYDNIHCLGEPIEFGRTRVLENLSLYPKFINNNSNWLNYNTDIFNFTNTSIPWRPVGMYYNALKDQATWYQRIGNYFTSGAIYGTTPDNGTCFGMDALLLANKKGAINFKSMGLQDVAEIQDPNISFENKVTSASPQWHASQLLTYFQNIQFVGKIRKQCRDYSKTESKNVERIVQKALKSSEPFIIGVDTRGKGEGGHALIVYGCSKNSDGSYTLNYWDPNFATSNQTASVDANMTDIYFELYPRGFVKDFVDTSRLIEYRFGPLKDSTVTVLRKQTETDELEYADNYFTVNYSNFTITTSTGRTAVIKDHDYYSGDSDLVEWLGTGNSDEEQLYRVPDLADGETYTIVPEYQEGLAEYITSYEHNSTEADGIGASLKSTAPVAMTVNNDGVVKTESSETVEQSVISVREDQMIASEFSGDTKGFTVTPSTNSITAVSLSNASVKVVTYDDNDNKVENTINATASNDIVVEEEQDGVLTVEHCGMSNETTFDFTVSFEVVDDITYIEPITGVESGDKISRPVSEIPGYKIECFKDAACTEAWDFTVDTVTSDLTLYAKYVEDDSSWVTLSYKSDDEELDATTYVYAGDTNYDLVAPEAKDGYLFMGWYLDEDLNTPLTKGYTFSENTTLYARWEEIQTIELEDGDTYKTYGEKTSSVKGFGLTGCQIRFNRDDRQNGLRFVSRVSKALINDLSSYGEVKYGHYLRTGLTSEDVLDSSNGKKLEANTLLYEGNNYSVFSAAVINIPEASVNTEIWTRPYIEYTDVNGNKQTYLYSEDTARHYSGAYYSTLARVAKFIVKNDNERLSNSRSDLQQYIRALADKCTDK